MTDAMEVLFLYAEEHMANSLLCQEQEYANVHQCVQKQQETFLASLSGDAQKRFDALLDEKNLLTSLYGRAMFRAGFRLALELGR